MICETMKSAGRFEREARVRAFDIFRNDGCRAARSHEVNASDTSISCHAQYGRPRDACFPPRRWRDAYVGTYVVNAVEGPCRAASRGASRPRDGGQRRGAGGIHMPHMHDRFQGAQSPDEAFRGGAQRRPGDSQIAER